MVQKYRLRFFFEWQIDTCFWAGSDTAYDRFGVGPIPPEALGLSTALAARIRALSAWHDTALNWAYPPDPGPWRQDECDRFNQAVNDLFNELTQAFGAAFELINQHHAEQEDPDLERYLRDPQGFRRNTAGQEG